MVQLKDCPDPAWLARVIDPAEHSPDADAAAEHLVVCKPCRLRVEADLAPVARALRTAHADETDPDQRLIDRLANRLKNLARAPSLSGTRSVDAPTKPVVSSSGLALSPSAVASDLGTLGRFRVLAVLGEGGMGVVLRAFDPRLNREVALKVMKAGPAASPAVRARFLGEARAMAALTHDHVIHVFDTDENDTPAGRVPWLAMPLLPGESLGTRLRRGEALTVAESLRIAEQTASALAAAHAKPLIHRDIKPDNLWLETVGGGWRVKVLDFGLARGMERAADEHHTLDGAIVGTPAFMAPEQARGEPADARADVFSLGCVLYECLTGVRPFRGVTLMESLSRVLAVTPDAPHLVRPGVSRAVSAFVMRLLAKDAVARPTAAEAARELARLAAEEGRGYEVVEDEPVPDPEPLRRPRRLPQRQKPRWGRQMVVLAALAVAIVAVAVPAIVVIIRDKDGNKVAEVAVPPGGTVLIRPDDTKPVAPPPKPEPPKTGRVIGHDEKVVGRDQPPLLRAPFTAEEAAAAQKKWAEYMKCPVETEIDLGKDCVLPVVLIPPGTFLMGSAKDEIGHQPDEKQHEVTIPRPFWLGKTEVTQEQWLALNDTNPSEYQNGGTLPNSHHVAGQDTSRQPVTDLTWDETVAFCRAVGKRVPKRRGELPSEAQWEYACRAGTVTPFNVGKTLDRTQANMSKATPENPFLDGNVVRLPKLVGSYPKSANAFGLLDMHGNVQEWCADVFDINPAAPTPFGSLDGPARLAPDSGSRVIRGGSWGWGPESAYRSARRRPYPAHLRTSGIGFRVCLVLSND